MAERPEEDPVLVDEEGSMSTDDDDDEDYDEDEELGTEEDDAVDVSLTSILAQLVGGGRVHAASLSAGRPRFRRLRDVVQLPLQHPADVVHNILLNTTALNKRRRCDAPSLDSGRDPSNLRIRYHGPRVHSQPHADPSLQDSLGPALSCQALPSTGRLSSVLSLLLGPDPASPDSGTPAVPVPDSPAVTAMLWPSGPDACQLHCSPPSPAAPASAACSRSPFAAAAATVPAAPSQATTPAADQPRRLRSPTAREAEQQQNPPAAQEAAFSNSSGTSDLGISSSRRILGSIMRRLSGSRNTEGSSGGAGEATRRASQESVMAVAEEPKEEELEVTRREAAPWSGVTQVNTAKLLAKRELGLGDVTRLSRSQQIHLQTQQNALPLEPTLLVDQHEARCYIGQFSRDGAYFVAAYQDQRVHVYEVRERGPWRLRKDVRPRNVRWTITDTCTSPDQQFLIYCSIHPTVHLVNLGSSSGPVESLANITEVHESLSFDEEQHMAERFGIWSVRWSRTGHDLIAGTNNDSVYVYDMGESKVVARARGHNDDVNAVEYLDDSPNHILTGSDDTLIKLWDRRQLDGGRRQARAAGVFVGHTEGLTHLNTKGDGNCFISNSKDQTIKMWDMRYGMRTENQAVGLRNTATNYSWDYRWMSYPGRGLDIKHPHDGSVMTYRGHEVHQTLIRAYFSPAATTGQRFIYSGSADNSVHIWDVITGHEVAQLHSHKQLVRDVSWHPSLPMIASVSWDGDVIAWTPTAAMGRRAGGMMAGTQGVAVGARRRAHWS